MCTYLPLLLKLTVLIQVFNNHILTLDTHIEGQTLYNLLLHLF